MKFYIVDAFTETLFRGNTAGVVIINEKDDFPNDNIMIKTAAELRYSETVFVKILDENKFHFRYFTPIKEVDLCGHATLGAFEALIEEGRVKDGEIITITTLAGLLDVSVDNGMVMMDMSEPIELKSISDKTEIAYLANIMGITIEDIGSNPQLISTGLPDIILEVKTKEKLMAISPNYEKLSKLSENYNVVGVHAFTMAESSSDITAYCRNFAPLYGIDEEAATGTSNGALTYFLYKQKKIQEGQTNIFIQGESMERLSKVKSILSYNENSSVRIQVGGKSKILAKGEIFISSC